jgi:PPOX class probable F420-dependent enzyme
MDAVLPDPATPVGARVAQRLRDEAALWLTAVAADGTPQANPVWFLWVGHTVLVYNQPTAKHLVHIRRHPKVALHCNSNGQDGDIIVMTGEARLSPEEPQADRTTWRRASAPTPPREPETTRASPDTWPWGRRTRLTLVDGP